MISNEILFQRADILEKIGLSRIESRVLSILLDGKPYTSRKIERDMDLRQPEVSNGILLLKKRNWIHENEISSKMKGRPQKEYKLSTNFEDIIAELRDSQTKDHTNKMVNILLLVDLCQKK